MNLFKKRGGHKHLVTVKLNTQMFTGMLRKQQKYLISIRIKGHLNYL